MPCLAVVADVPAAIVAALVTEMVPAVLPTSLSLASMPWPCVEVSVTPEATSTRTDPAS